MLQVICPQVLACSLEKSICQLGLEEEQPTVRLLLFLHLSFWIVLLFWQRLRSLLFKPPTIFLDRLCIAQHVEELKQKGILGLAGFLDRSRQLTILWSPRYFSRIWCTYEVATFLRDPGNQKPILVMPVKMALILFLFAVTEHIIMYWYWLAHDVAGTDSNLDLLTLFFGFAPALALVVPVVFYVGLGLMQDLKELPHQLANFSVQRAQCFCCSNGHTHPQTGATLPCDRELIFGMLKRWYGNPHGEADEHLRLFDRQVKQGLAPTVIRSLGRGWLPIRYKISMVCFSGVPGLSRAIVALAAGPPEGLAGIGGVVWRLRTFMEYSMPILLTFSWVQVSLFFLHYASLWTTSRLSRVVVSAVLWIPACIPLSVEWFSFQLCMINTSNESLLPVLPFLIGTGLHILLSRFSDGPAGQVQSVGDKLKAEPAFEEAALEVVVDEQSTADSISTFST